GGGELPPYPARALLAVWGRGPGPPSVRAGRRRSAPRSATEVVDSLEARGLVQRTPGPDDRRAVRVGATEAGRQMQETAWAARERAAEEFFGRLEPPEREELGRLLRRLLD